MVRISVVLVLCGILLVVWSDFATATTDKERQPCLYVQANTLNVRETASLSAKIQRKLPKNAEICSYSVLENGFLRIQDGYIAAEYLKFTKAEESLKVATIPSPLSPKISQDFKAKLELTSKQKEPELNIAQQAKVALEHKDYALAKTLALRLNQQNPNNSESWEIFAKSLYLEGNSHEAILLLENFLQQNQNVNLSKLLDKMQQGQVI